MAVATATKMSVVHLVIFAIFLSLIDFWWFNLLDWLTVSCPHMHCWSTFLFLADFLQPWWEQHWYCASLSQQWLVRVAETNCLPEALPVLQLVERKTYSVTSLHLGPVYILNFGVSPLWVSCSPLLKNSSLFWFHTIYYCVNGCLTVKCLSWCEVVCNIVRKTILAGGKRYPAGERGVSAGGKVASASGRWWHSWWEEVSQLVRTGNLAGGKGSPRRREDISQLVGRVKI
jgi:hypothetical protein